MARATTRPTTDMVCGIWYLKTKPAASVPWQLSNLMNLLLDPDFRLFAISMIIALLLAVAVAEILAQRKHRLALQSLRVGRDCHPKGGHQ